MWVIVLTTCHLRSPPHPLPLLPILDFPFSFPPLPPCPPSLAHSLGYGNEKAYVSAALRYMWVFALSMPAGFFFIAEKHGCLVL